MCPLIKCTHGHPTARDTATSVSCASFQRKNCTIKLAARNGTGKGNGVWFISALFFFSFFFFKIAVGIANKVTSGLLQTALQHLWRIRVSTHLGKRGAASHFQPKQLVSYRNAPGQLLL